MHLSFSMSAALHIWQVTINDSMALKNPGITLCIKPGDQETKSVQL